MASRSARRTAAVALMLSAACAGGGGEPPDLPLRRAYLEVIASWSGAEQERFAAVLAGFERRSGAVVRYTSAQHRLTDVLDERVRTGRAPDVALLPQPGQLQAYARSGALVPLEAPTRSEVTAHFPPRWQELGSFQGTFYGVWFKAANKSLVWYDVAVFERWGLTPPSDLVGLRRVADRLREVGVAAFAVSPGDAWTLTDWFENLYLRIAGPQRYDDLAGHRIPWTDPSVLDTLRLLSSLLDPSFTSGAADTDFEDSVELAFQQHRAAMVVEGDFVAAAVTASTQARLGVDVDVFAFPAATSGVQDPAIIGGGDVAVIFRSSPAAQALVRYLATPGAAAVWAKYGGFVSPNADVDLSLYPDELSHRIARSVVDAGNDYHFDLSDLQPTGFGASREAGLYAELRAFLVHRDAKATAERLERQASAAYVAAAEAATTPRGGR